MPPQTQDPSEIPQPIASGITDQPSAGVKGYKPNDIMTGMNGQQYKVIATDQNGRVVQAEPLKGGGAQTPGKPQAPSKDPIDFYLALPRDQQKKFFEGLTPAGRQKLFSGVQQKKQKTAGQPTSQPSGQPSQPTGQPTATIGAKPPLTSVAGMKEKGYTLAQQGLELLPSVGGIVGGLVGGAAGTAGEPGAGTVALGAVGAGAGGALGKIGEQAGKEALFGEKPPEQGMEELQTVGWEGIKQAAYELVGRAVGGIAGAGIKRLIAGPGEKLGTTIAGEKIPETAGQLYGRPSGILQQAEHYTKGTFVGGSLKDIQAAQEAASRKIINQLSESAMPPGAAPVAGISQGLSMSENWERAREATRITAEPLYEQLTDIPAHHTATRVVAGILSDENLRLSTKAKNTLIDALGPDAWENLRKHGIPPTGDIEVGQLIGARSELAKLGRSLKDPVEKSGVLNARDQINEVIKKSLTPLQQPILDEADRLWHRSYIMNEIAGGVKEMERTQDPLKQKKLAVDAFVKMVNDLATPERAVGREAGQIVKHKTDLEILFDKPGDRTAIVQLASFLKSKYSRLAGQTGPAENFARVGLLFDALAGVSAAATLHPIAAGTALTPVAGLYAAAKVLSDPGGAVRLLKAVAGVSGTVGAVAGKTAIGGTQAYQRAQAIKRASQKLGPGATGQQIMEEANRPEDEE